MVRDSGDMLRPPVRDIAEFLQMESAPKQAIIFVKTTGADEVESQNASARSPIERENETKNK